MERFAGRVAVITGAAKGIGFGLAERCAAEGMKVVLADIDQRDLDVAVQKLQARGAEVLGVHTDVRVEKQVEALAQQSVQRFGAVHLLCNNAGVGGFQSFETTSLATWRWQMDVNLWGPIYGCHYFLPILKQQDEAHIVNTASVAGFVYSGITHPYHVAKAGVVALSEGLQQDLAQSAPHVGVSVLCPAQVATTIATDDQRHAPPDHVRREIADPSVQAVRASLVANLAKGKQPSEVAEQVLRAVRERKLHIFTHPEWLDIIRARMDGVYGSGADPAA